MKYFLIFLSVLLLASCWEESIEVTPSAKNEQKVTNTGSAAPQNSQNISENTQKRPSQTENTFSIEVETLSEFQNNYTIEKNWKILPNQTLSVSPQVSGDVANVYVKQGDRVNVWQTLVLLKDSYSKYSLDIQKAQIDYDKQVISKESQIVSMNKNISDLERNLADAKRLYDNAVLTAIEDTKSAEIAYENSSILDVNSSAYLAIEKAQLDYNSILNDNQQSIQWFLTDAQKEYNNLYLNIVDIIEFSDKLFWITDRNKDIADEIDSFFGAMDSGQKNQTESLLLEIISYKNYLETLDPDNITQDDILTFLNTYKDGYLKVTKFLNQLEITTNNSITSIGTLSQWDIDSYISQINNYQGGNQWDSSSYNSTYKSIENFLANYKNDELLALKNLETTKKNYENSEDNASIAYNKTLINIDNTLQSAKKNYESIQASYDLAVADKELTIRSLDNTIESAKNTLTKAQVEYGKLRITAPISWIVSELNVDTWEYVGTNNQLVTIISDNNTQIEVDLSENEVQNIALWDPVNVIYRTKSYSWSIFSIWSLADEALNYNVTVNVQGNIPLVWWSATVEFQNKEVSNISIPFNLVDVTTDDKGTINTLNEWKLELIEVSLGKISGNNIEILSEIPVDTQVITTNLTNYNPNIQTFSIK